MVSAVSELKRREREMNFSKELVSTEPIPVPHAQPEGTRGQLTLLNLGLQLARIIVNTLNNNNYYRQRLL